MTIDSLLEVIKDYNPEEEDNESIIDAAIRETKEETNIDIDIKGLIAIQETISELGQLFIVYFLGDYVSGRIKYDKKEIADVKWMTETEILSLDKKQIRGYETIKDILKLSKESLIPLERIEIIKL